MLEWLLKRKWRQSQPDRKIGLRLEERQPAAISKIGRDTMPIAKRAEGVCDKRRRVWHRKRSGTR